MPICLAMFGLGTQELLIFMVIVLIIFGSARLPSLMRNLGRSANEFKAGMKLLILPHSVVAQTLVMGHI